MLKIFSARNFIHYSNGIHLEFQSGANFLIGRNATGKSAALELIRRCHSRKINITTVSSISNSKHAAFSFCVYEQIGTWKGKNIQEALISIYVDSENDTCDRKIYKTVVLDTDTPDFIVYSTIIDFKNNNDRTKVGPSRIKKSQLLTNYTEDDVKQLVLDVKEITSKDEDTWEPSLGNTETEDFLNFLRPQFEATMPHRGIAPVMWTGALDKYECDLDKQALCEVPTKRADIIRELLNDKENIDQSEAAKIFNQLCSEAYEFSLKENTLTATTCGKEVPIFRVPAGAFEAKQLSLLLAHKKIKTLCLEEPYRGMHQGMTKKLGNLVLQRVKGKTLVIVSHEQALINPWSLQRTYIFKKTLMQQNLGSVVHEAVKFPNDCIKYGESEEMKSVLFSSSVAFVEGETDRIILQALFSQMVNEERRSQLGKVFEYLKNSTSLDDKSIESIFARVELVKLDGEKGGLCRQKFCKDIGIPCVVILDRGAILTRTNFPSEIRPNYLADGDGSHLSGPIISSNDWHEKYHDISEYLNNKDIFIWEAGNIEHVIVKEVEKKKDHKMYSKMGLGSIEGGDKQKVKKWKSELKSKNPTLVENFVVETILKDREALNTSELARLVAFIAKRFGNQNLNTSTIQRQTEKSPMG